MEIDELRVVNGANLWSEHYQKLVLIKPRFNDRDAQQAQEMHKIVQELLPPGFTINRDMGPDTRQWLASLVAQVAAALQPARNRLYYDTIKWGEETCYAIFAYEEEETGVEAAHTAIAIVNDLLQGRKPLWEKEKEKIGKLYQEVFPGPSTQAIVDAAEHRDIPAKKIGQGKYIVLGQGKYQKKIEASIIETTGNISVDIAGNKETTKQLLADALIPVPKGITVTDEKELSNALEIGFPLLTKPLDGHQGQGITGNISDEKTLRAGFKLARQFSDQVIVEQFIPGNDYRFLVIGFKLIAAAHRIPASVTGDGQSTIQQLVDQVNADPLRGEGHEKVMTTIKIDEHTLALLKSKGLKPGSVPAKGEVVYLKQTANLSTGGTAVDVTDDVHPDNVVLIEKAARIIGLDICGIDVMAPDVATPFNENGGVILEVNAAPGLRMHIAPSKGKPRNVGDPIIDLLFPPGTPSRIPIVAVTGTNGKTTTVRLMAALASGAGYHTGFTCTDGIYINGQQIEKGDCSGTQSAAVVLNDPTVDFAVLECARGGILRSGLAFDHCNVGILTNVAADHIGLKDIRTLDDMARVKSVVPKSVATDGLAILNAADERVYAIGKEVKGQVGLFALDENNPHIVEHCSKGGWAAVTDSNQNVVILKGHERIRVENVMNIPLTMKGKADFMTENVLPVALAAYFLGFPVEKIAEVLRSFVPSAEQTPGRMNQFDVGGATVMIDYAHNPHGLKALGRLLKKIDAKKTGIITGVGDRRDEDIIELGRIAGDIYDKVIIRLDDDTRGRDPDEIVALLIEGLQESRPGIPHRVIPDTFDSIRAAVKDAQKGEYVVANVEKVETAIDFIRELQEEYGRKEGNRKKDENGKDENETGNKKNQQHT